MVTVAVLEESSTASSSSGEAGSWIVGTLQLCNLHTGSGIVEECLALADSSGSVCCHIPCFDCRFLNQTVRIRAWKYTPGVVLEKSRGLLEVLSLELVGRPCFSYARESFPSLCVDPGSADARDHVLESPLGKSGKGKRLEIQGFLQCISPPFFLPQGHRAEEPDPVACQSRQQRPGKHFQQSMLGFMVELGACRHEARCQCLLDEQEGCGAQDEGRTVDRGNAGQVCSSGCPGMSTGLGAVQSDDTLSKGPKSNVWHVYFSAAVSCWRPVLSGSLGQCVGITGLRRKSLKADGVMYRFYVATRTTMVLPSTIVEAECSLKGVGHDDDGRRRKVMRVEGSSSVRFPGGSFWKLGPKELVAVEHGEVTSYKGTVTGLFEQGSVVEIDGSVLLLLTHYRNIGLRNLRAGATISAYNVHKLVINNHCTESVLLGACSRSHLVVETISALNILHHVHEPFQSTLSKGLEHLTFASTLWYLLVMSSFCLKFQDIYNREELFGTKKGFGLTQEYLSLGAICPPTVKKRNHVKEFMHHDEACTLSELLPTNYGLQIPPISNVLRQMRIIWHDTTSVLWHNEMVSPKLGQNENQMDGMNGRYLRRTLSGSDLGVIFLGYLQVSRLTGKLQLVDGTGAIDVVVPDFASVLSLYKLYEVRNYLLVVEGFHSSKSRETVDGCDEDGQPLSWTSILKQKLYSRSSTDDSMTIFLHFHLVEATWIRQLPWPPSSRKEDTLQVLEQLICTERRCTFSVLMITYKHPVTWKGIGQARYMAEALFLPCFVVLLGKGDNPFQSTGITSSTMLPDGTGDRRGSESFGCSVCFPPVSHQRSLKLSNYYRVSQESCDAHASKSGMLSINDSTEEKGKSKILLEFSLEAVDCYTALRVGECYLLETHHAQRSHTKGRKADICVGMPVWSLQVATLQGVPRTSCVTMPPHKPAGHAPEVMLQKRDSTTSTLCRNGLSAVPSSGDADVVLNLPAEGVDSFKKLVSDGMVLGVLNLKDALSQPSDDHETQMYPSGLVGSLGTPSRNVLSGNLVSFTGRVKKISLLQCPKEEGSSWSTPWRSEWVEIVVQDLEGPETAKVLFSVTRTSLPAGLGEEATLTCHRVLRHASSDSTCCYKCTSATVLVVHNIPEVPVSSLFAEEAIPGLRLLQPYCPGKDPPPQCEIRGRVVRVRKLVFYWQGGAACLWRDLKPNTLGSSIAPISGCFTIDDGTRNTVCWATGYAAASLLGLPGVGGYHHQPNGTFYSTFPGQDPSLSITLPSISLETAWIVQKHGQIIIQSDGWEVDAGGTCLTITGAGNQPVTSHHQQAILKALVLQACHNRPWDLLCELRVSKQTSTHPNAKRHYLVVKSVEPVEYVRGLKNMCARLSAQLSLSS